MKDLKGAAQRRLRKLEDLSVERHAPFDQVASLRAPRRDGALDFGEPYDKLTAKRQNAAMAELAPSQERHAEATLAALSGDAQHYDKRRAARDAALRASLTEEPVDRVPHDDEKSETQRNLERELSSAYDQRKARYRD